LVITSPTLCRTLASRNGTDGDIAVGQHADVDRNEAGVDLSHDAGRFLDGFVRITRTSRVITSLTFIHFQLPVD